MQKRALSTTKKKTLGTLNTLEKKDSVYLGIPITKNVLNDGNMIDIVLNCQVAVSRIAFRFPAEFLVVDGQTDQFITPAYLAAYFALYVLKVGWELGLVTFTISPMPNNIFQDDYVVPSVLATWAINYWKCNVGPLYERKLVFDTDWAIPNSAISRNYAANSFSAIQDYIGGTQNPIFNSSLGVYSILPGVTTGTNTFDSLVNVASTYTTLFTGASPFYTSPYIRKISAWLISLDVDCDKAGSFTGLSPGEGSSFMHPVAYVTVPYPLNLLNANSTQGPYPKTSFELTCVYRPTISFADAASNVVPFNSEYTVSAWLPHFTNGSVSNYGTNGSNGNRVNKALQTFWYIGLNGKRSKFFESGDFFKSFTLNGLRLPKTFDRIVPTNIDYVTLMRKCIRCYIAFRSNKAAGFSYPFNSNEYNMVYWYIDMLLRAKIQEVGQVDLTYGIGAAPGITSFQNFCVPRSFLSGNSIAFIQLVVRAIGIVGHKGRILVPNCNYNFSVDGQANSSQCVVADNSVVASPLYPATALSTALYPAVNGTLPQFPWVYTPYNFLNGSVPYFPSGTGSFTTAQGLTYTGYTIPIAPNPFSASFDGSLGQLLCLFTNGPAIVANLSTLMGSFLSLNYNTTGAMPPILHNFGSVSNVAIRVLYATQNNYADFQMSGDLIQMVGQTTGATIAQPRLSYPASLGSIMAYDLVDTVAICETVTIGVQSLYMLRGGAELGFNILGSFTFNTEVESNMVSNLITQTVSAESTFLEQLYEEYKTHAYDSKSIIAKKVIVTRDCYRKPVQTVMKLLSQAISSPVTPLIAETACKVAKFGIQLTPAAGAASLVECEAVRKWAGKAQKIFSNNLQTTV